MRITRVSDAPPQTRPPPRSGPHNHQIGALAVALRQVATPSFRAYAGRVRANAAALGAALSARGYKLVTGGTDNHLVLWDLRPLDLTGSKVGLPRKRTLIRAAKYALGPC